MKPLQHAKNSARKHGGRWEDYIEIHDFFDSSKAALADMRHRALFHSAFGIFVVEQVFGTVVSNSDRKLVCVRDIGEDHVLEDLGFIPTAEQWLRNMKIQDWMLGEMRGAVKEKFVPMEKKPRALGKDFYVWANAVGRPDTGATAALSLPSKRCSEDGCVSAVRWVRHTQFAGDHRFCDQHARAQDDFGRTNSSYFDWEEINVKAG